MNDADAFEGIRPYTDAEMPAVIARLLADRAFLDAVIRFRFPGPSRWAPGPLRWFVARYLGWRAKRLRTIDAFQSSLESWLDHMIETTSDGFSWSGIDRVRPGRAYLFVSNHRDIAMDSALMNYVLHAEGRGTSRVAIGDNLLRQPFAAELMRLNKSFVVRRSVKGIRDQLAAFTLTSRYLHHSIAEGVSVWIAQREGRAKDGRDLTEPAIVKMFQVSQRKSGRPFGEIIADLHLLPVAVSYELDPCDTMKAHELAVRAATGTYAKPEDEDLRSIVRGITGEKGRVHLSFGEELVAPGDDADAVAAAIDRQIHAGFRLFPTHLDAYRRLGGQVPEALEREVGPLSDAIGALFAARLDALPVAERPWLLAQYAAPVAFRLGVPPPSGSEAVDVG
ncbi:MAG: 1-acyl-sn-glycerol-3-phosphate acyltransferase [Pseudomonadales bacterium]|jgi:hypothetical protein|nr:1-acyl-sn-glycerol-3-phosphate acyltransferase [Pseudomonadales bacterium]